MTEVTIEYKISETEKEIYGFSRSGNTYTYCSIFYSSRDDKNDEWGEVWKNRERDVAYKNLNDNLDEMDDDEVEVIEEYIRTEYNPCLNKTIHGKTRYWEMSFGSMSKEYDKHLPKLSYKEIETLILKKIKPIKIVGY